MKQKYRLPSVLAFFIVFFTSLNLYSQQDRLLVYGTVKDERSGKKLSEVNVILVEDGTSVNTFTTTLNGKFELDLDFGHDYDVRFTKVGYVTKFININTQNVPDANKVGGFGFDLDMSLFEEIEGVNFDILKKPIGKANYVESSGEIGFDYEYTRSIQAEIARLRRELEKKYAEEEDRLRREQEEAERLRLLQEQFDALVAQGDTEFGNSNFMNAVFKFSDALDLIPNVAVVEQKLAKAKAALEEQQKQAELEAEYAAIIKSGDAAVGSQKWEEAKAKFERALELKPNEAYPQQQLNTINRQLEDLAAQQALNEKFNGLITKADGEFNGKNFETAVATYQQALALKPEEKYPQDQIQKANQALEALKKQQELEEQYADLITSADASFNSEKYDDAIGLYTEALKIKAGEAYPTEQIAKARGAIAAQQEQEKLNEQYKSIIAKADNQMKAKDYNTAITSYQSALELKPEEAYPTNQIAKAQGILADLEADKILEGRYNDLIVEADANMNASNFTEAIANYKKALELKPNEDYPRDQIAAAEAGIIAKQQATELEKQYQALIARADKEFSDENYTTSLASFQEANALKPAEQYPIDQIAKIQGILEKEQQQEKQYADLIAKADGAFGKNKFDDAIASYQAALQIKDEAYPKEQITKAQAEIDKLKQQQAQEQQYADLIAKADKSFDAETYEQAIVIYNQALEIKANEQYPKDQIALATSRMEEIAKEKELMGQYNQLITSADGKFNGTEYQGAITDYEAALALRPDENYPKDQINKAKEILANQAAEQEKRAEYNRMIAAADKEMNAENYNPAINNYQAALQILPNESYPKEQITKAQNALADLEKAKEINAKYQGLIAKADGQFSQKEYTQAINTYNGALELKPSEQYPKDQIAKAEKALDDITKQQELDAEFNTLITEADAQFNNDNYQEAIAKYDAALNIKPGAPYPTEQIAKAEMRLQEILDRKNQEVKYQELIASGDKKFDAGSYESSINDYQAALVIKANEPYPTQQIEAAQNELQKLMAQKQMENQYAAAVQKADVLFDSTEYVAAIQAYQSALQLKPGESYPKTQIAEAQRLQEVKAKKDQLRNQYLGFIEQGDNAFGKKSYQEAITYYQDALSLVPGEQYPKDQITKAQAEIDKLRSAYDAAVEYGDSELNAKRYLSAITSYENALVMFPKEPYPKQKIEEAKAAIQAEEDALAQKQAEELLAQQKAEEEAKDPTIVSFKDITTLGEVKTKPEEKPVVEEPVVEEKNPEPKVMYKTTSEGDLDAFRRLLGENYPEGITREQYRESNKDIFRVIFVKDGLGDELLRVVARFGTFYFKNGSSISSFEYKNVLASFEGN